MVVSLQDRALLAACKYHHRIDDFVKLGHVEHPPNVGSSFIPNCIHIF